MVAMFYDEWGIMRDDKERFIGVNANRLIEQYLELRPTVYLEGKRYYQYSQKKGVWKSKTLLNITRELRKLVHKRAPAVWDSALSREVEAMLPLICDSVD